MNAEDIFQQAIDGKTPAEREAFVASACGTDGVLFAKVQGLLKAHDDASQFLEKPLFVSAPTVEQPLYERPGTQIGPYKLLQQIGEGGMGIVFMAEQTQPVQRKVALKIIRPGMDSRQVIARFEAERQALAMMDHVNIARVFDGGTTESGRPYFVMELINGVPITKYCDDNHLTPRERLELFVPVCQAIQHAHQKGIIHRDIKPSNVLVTLYDGKPVPKVIDFGVAKATEQKLTERTLFTNFGTMVGTLEYMSPEQADSNALGIDTRSDIYSLGVLLYELLTGSTPLTRKQFKEAANFEILRMIKEDEPQKPSTRLSESGDALASISAQRKMEPAKLSKLVRGELDWIVMKTLEKDRNRRYETANGLAVDLLRYLNDEAVLACPPSRGYRLGKFVRKNRGAVVAATVVFVSLVGGIVGTTAGLFEANRQRENAQTAESVAKDRLVQVTHEKERATLAEKEAKQNEMYARQSHGDMQVFIDYLIDVLSSARPKGVQGGLGIDVTVVRALEAAEANIEKRFSGHPNAEAIARTDLGKTWRNLGKFKQAEFQLRRAAAIREKQLGPEHYATLDTLNSLGVLLTQMDRYKEAIAIHEKVFKTQARTLGGDHLNTLFSAFNLSTAYLAPNGNHEHTIEFCKSSLETMRKKLGHDHQCTLGTMSNLAVAYSYIGKLPEAISLLQQVVEAQQTKLGQDHPDTLTSMMNLADFYCSSRRFAEAIQLFKETLEKQQAKLGKDHPDVLKTMTNFAKAYTDSGEYVAAEALLRQAVEGARSSFGPHHPLTLEYISGQGYLNWKMRKYSESVRVFKDLLKIACENMGTNDDFSLKTASNLLVNFDDAGRLNDALNLTREWMPLWRTQLSMDDETRQRAYQAALSTYRKLEHYDQAEPLYRELVQFWKQKAGAISHQHAEQLALLGINLRKQRKYSEAEKTLRECLTIREQVEADIWMTFTTKYLVGACLLDQKNYTAAEPLILAGYEGMMAREAQVPPYGKFFFDQIRGQLVKLYEATGQPEKAETWRRKMTTAKSSKQMEAKKD